MAATVADWLARLLREVVDFSAGQNCGEGHIAITLISMNHALFKALIALLPASLLFSGSAILWLRGRTAFLFMQLCGAGCIAVVVLTHICEALHLFPGMNWGMEHSLGHYVDLVAAVIGFTLFPAGYLLSALFQK